jgi:hypothetical protein
MSVSIKKITLFWIGGFVTGFIFKGIALYFNFNFNQFNLYTIINYLFYY